MTASSTEGFEPGSLLPTLCVPPGATTFQGPLPRPVRKRRKPPQDKGLPDDDELRLLAKIFLEKSRETWPELAAAGVLPKPTAGVLDEYVENFKRRHRGGQVGQVDLVPFTKLGLSLAADYPRFSDDNSQTKSISDQMRLAIAHGKTRNSVVMWEFLLADYACSASTGRRQGFDQLLALIASNPPGLKYVLIDDFARGSRNELESWKLAGLCKSSEIQLVGVSDGFSSANENWELYVSVYNMFHKMELKSKRQRVLRGQNSTAETNVPIGRLPFGYTRRVVLDAQGQPLFKSNGVPRTERCVDPESSQWLKMMFEMFIVKRWSTYKIAKEFNRLGIDGWDRWTDVSIEKTLTHPAYIGLFVWNRSSKVYDWALEKEVWRPNNWKLWKIYCNKELALIPKSWHVEARNRLVKPKQDASRPKRRKPQRLARTLFSGTLVCGYCGKELTLFRSTPKYKNLGCENGIHHFQRCKLTSSKSTRTIETTLLSVIRDQLLTEERLVDLVRRANEQLTQLRTKPKTNLRPLQQKCEKLRGQIDQLIERLAATQSDEVVVEYEAKIESLRVELKQAAADLAAAQRHNSPPPPDLALDRVQVYLEDFRRLLNQETPAAAEAIRALTGPISFTQKPYPSGKQGAIWIATFTPSLERLLGYAAVNLDYPDSPTTEVLTARNWTSGEELTVEIDKIGWTKLLISSELKEKLLAVFKLTPEKCDYAVGKLLGCGAKTVKRYREFYLRGEL